MELSEYLKKTVKPLKTNHFGFEIKSIENHLMQTYCELVNAFSINSFIINKDVQTIIKLTAKWFKQGKQNLLLIGEYGTGKTKILETVSLLINFYENKVTKVINTNEIIKTSLSTEDCDINKFNNFKNFPYLFIDDLGTEPVDVKYFGTVLNPVIEILLERYRQNKTTVISTNLTLNEINQKYGQRIWERFIEKYDTIIFDYQSFRTKYQKHPAFEN